MVGYGKEDDHFVVELTYNYGIKHYDKGNDFQVCLYVCCYCCCCPLCPLPGLVLIVLISTHCLLLLCCFVYSVLPFARRMLPTEQLVLIIQSHRYHEKEVCTF